jgi:hypothetical protein
MACHKGCKHGGHMACHKGCKHLSSYVMLCMGQTSYSVRTVGPKWHDMSSGMLGTCLMVAWPGCCHCASAFVLRHFREVLVDVPG